MRTAAILAMHGEQIEIVFGELPQNRRRIDINDADDVFASLKRYRHQAADILLDNALTFPQGFVVGGIANQHGGARFYDAITDRGRDAKALAAVCLRHQYTVFERKKDAAIAFDSVDCEFENEAEEFGQRPIAGKFVTGADERGDLRGGEALRFSCAFRVFSAPLPSRRRA